MTATLPFTSNFFVGLATPMPTLPVEVSTKRFEFNDRFSPLFATMLEVVMVPVILRLDSEPVGGSMAPAVRVNPEAMTRFELIVMGEAPTMLDAVRVVPGPMSKSDNTLIFVP